LNIAFGENSWLAAENGFDMLWNPSSTVYNNVEQARFGGMHNIYLFRSDSLKEKDGTRIPHYDESSLIYEYLMQNPTSTNRRRVFRAATWVSIPLLNEGYEMLPIEEGLIPTKTTIRVHVNKPYARMNTKDSLLNNGLPLYYFKLEDGINGVYLDNEVEDCFDVYPNPNNGSFTLDLRALIQNTVDLSVYDHRGRLVRVELIENEKFEQFQYDLKAGVYLFVLSNSNQIICSKKVIFN